MSTRWPLLLALAAAMTLACTNGSGSAAAGGEPIPECEDYVRSFAACTGRDAPVGTLLRSPDANVRRQAGDLCATNLKRLQLACPSGAPSQHHDQLSAK
jgi:hypothetical protein